MKPVVDLVRGTRSYCAPTSPSLHFQVYWWVFSLCCRYSQVILKEVSWKVFCPKFLRSWCFLFFSSVSRATTYPVTTFMSSSLNKHNKFDGRLGGRWEALLSDEENDGVPNPNPTFTLNCTSSTYAITLLCMTYRSHKFHWAFFCINSLCVINVPSNPTHQLFRLQRVHDLNANHARNHNSVRSKKSRNAPHPKSRNLLLNNNNQIRRGHSKIRQKQKSQGL